MDPKEKWVRSKVRLSNNSLIIGKQEVMQAWESNYMKMLASIVTKKGGKILEVGLGLGISAKFIQKYKPEKHIIIEAHPKVVKFGKKLFKKEINNKRIKIIKGFWQDLIRNFHDSSFDGILFDTFPLTYEEDEIPFLKEAYRLLKKGGILTFYSNEPKNISQKYKKILKDIGFSKIGFRICRVKPPKNCFYWKKNTIIGPIIIK